jgi:hypothetical protein
MENEPTEPYKGNKSYTADLDKINDKLLIRANEIHEKLKQHKIKI